MEDEHPPDDSATNPAHQAGIDAAREEDLDALLAEASELATEVSEEVGLSEDTPPSETNSCIPEAQTPATPGQNDPGPSDDIDSQLAQVDDLLRDTADQVGSETGESAESSDMGGAANVATTSGERSDDATDRAESAVAPEVPAFMGEFVDPNDGASSESVQQGGNANTVAQSFAECDPPAGPDAPTNPGAEQDTVKAGVVTSMPVGPNGIVQFPDAVPTPPVAEPISDASGADKDPDPAAQAAATLVPRMTNRLAPAVMNACARGVDLLEHFDAYLRWLGDGARRAIGWVALATLGTSVIALIISLF